MPTAHVDRFAAQHLPPADQQPDYLFELPELQFPAQLNCATELLDARVAAGEGARTCILAPGGLRWTCADLLQRANRIAQVLVQDMDLVPGNRVLLCAPNTPMLAAAWFGVIKAGGIAVATMPLLRAGELRAVITKAQISHALCDARLAGTLADAMAAGSTLRQVRHFQGADAAPGGPGGSLEADMQRHDGRFTNVDTAADDTCVLAFTSGTTGVPKATMHFHRDLVAICRCWPAHVLRPRSDDIFIGSPPLAFTFGLGGLLLFPMSVGAATVLLEKASPDQLAQAIAEHGATTLFTAPTSYRAMAAQGPMLRGTRLRQCVSAGEALPAATRALWREATGIELIDGIGATELLHIFISADEAHARAGATGKPVPGYVAQVQDDEGRPVPPGTVGRLAVKGPTGCRYLDDERQRSYVQRGWNLTGDAYRMDLEGYFHHQSRTDDMIVSAGYNIAAPEVEDALLTHPAVAECAVIGVPDEERGQIVKAFVVLRAGAKADAEQARALQDFVKQAIAPYKYPRAVAFVADLPRTGTGKLQRFRLRDEHADAAASSAKPTAAPAGAAAAAPAGAAAAASAPAKAASPSAATAALTTQPCEAVLPTPERSALQVLLPAGWPRPRGYANGVAASGRMVFVAGMIGWDAQGLFHTDDFAGQVRQALHNVVAVLAEGGAAPRHIVRMTWYVTDKREYLAAGAQVGQAFREIIGSYNAVMTAVQVSALIEDRAKVEIECTAVVPETATG